MSEIRFYLDENMDPEIAVQLVSHGIDAVSVRDLDLLGNIDPNHLKLATEMGRIVCTHDQDFLRMHSEGFQHRGIAFGKQYGSTLGGWIRALRKLYTTKTSEQMVGQVEYLSVK